MTTNRVLACVAAMAALCAALAGTSQSAQYSEERYGITALELAQWLREQRRVHVLDLRSESAFQEFALPAAMRVTVAELPQLERPRTDTVVLYGTDMDDAVRGWSLLHGAGFEHVNVLRGGVHEWASSVLNPVLPANATAEQEAAFADVAELSRYFGGVPRRGDEIGDGAAQPDVGAADAVQHIRRRGC